MLDARRDHATERTLDLIYLHGLNSSSRSHKADVLRRRLAPLPVCAPSYPAHRADQAVAVLSEVFQDLAARPVVVVGSSMGGFYGQYLARRFAVAHLFLINPALRPWEQLAAYAGQAMVAGDGEAYTLTPALLEAMRPYAVADPCDGVPTSVLLDAGDEVMDYRFAAAAYADCGQVRVFEGGDHAFQHLDLALPAIRQVLEAGG
jgi:predicted esterase YcpF (UPF0227 family)